MHIELTTNSSAVERQVCHDNKLSDQPTSTKLQHSQQHDDTYTVQAYCAKLATLLAKAKGDPESEAGLEAQVILQIMCSSVRKLPPRRLASNAFYPMHAL